MTIEELREEIEIELELIEAVVAEAISLRNDVGEREPTVREKTAAAAFIAQFYGGIENILKRIHRYYGIPMPVGDTWHIEICRRFSPPGYLELPILFDDSLARALSPYRKFRHVVYHGYGFQLEWDRMREGLDSLEGVHLRVKTVITTFLAR